MKASLIFSASLLSLTSVALANSELDGTWKFQKMECSSGAKLLVPVSTKKSLIGNGVSMAFNMTVKFDGNKSTLKTNIDVSYDLNGAEFQKNLKTLDEAIVFWNAQPDSAEKTKNLKQIVDSKEQYIATLKQGAVCESVTDSVVKISGGTIETIDEGVTITKCIPESANDESSDEKETDGKSNGATKYVVSGNILKTYSSQDDISIDAGSGDGTQKTCPGADEIVMYFQRR